MIPENLLILNYHKIEEQFDIGITTRTAYDFQSDLDLILNEGFTPIGFEQLLNNTIPEKPVIITFDDGYLSFYKHAFPILLEKKIPAVVYVPTYFLGKENYWDVQAGSKKYLHMNESQISDASRNGIEIGSHSVTHQYLKSMNDEELNFEITYSKNVIEKITAKPVLSFSYPFGRYNQKIIKQVRQNYAFAVTLTRPFFSMHNRYRHCLSRLNIYRFDSRQSLKRKLANDLIYKTRDWVFQNGSWATVILQKFKQADRTLSYESARNR